MIAVARQRLTIRRASETFAFECNGLRYIATISRFASGELAEIFIGNSKTGSHSDAAAQGCGCDLQHRSAVWRPARRDQARIAARRPRHCGDAIGRCARSPCRGGAMTRPASQPDFWQRRSARRAPLPIERRTHIALADLLRLQAHRNGWWFSHIPSGEYRTEKTGALLLRMGLKRGMSDFQLIAPDGRHLRLELKRGSAPLTESQKHFAEMLRERGVPHHVARSYEDAVEQLKAWGTL